MYYDLKYQVIHLAFITNTDPLCVLDAPNTWVYVQKITHQVNILSTHLLDT